MFAIKSQNFRMYKWILRQVNSVENLFVKDSQGESALEYVTRYVKIKDQSKFKREFEKKLVRHMLSQGHFSFTKHCAPSVMLEEAVFYYRIPLMVLLQVILTLVALSEVAG